MTNTIAAPRNREALEALGLTNMRGMTVTVTGYVDAGYVDVPEFTVQVVATNWYFDRISFVEVVHPDRGRLTVSIERCALHH